MDKSLWKRNARGRALARLCCLPQPITSVATGVAPNGSLGGTPRCAQGPAVCQTRAGEGKKAVGAPAWRQTRTSHCAPVYFSHNTDYKEIENIGWLLLFGVRVLKCTFHGACGTVLRFSVFYLVVPQLLLHLMNQSQNLRLSVAKDRRTPRRF